ncbi:MAG: hypothetical protein GY874_01925 [Desulfobacteraceae bacterium]|nr:hypothetical protein [Desulfobacteraceae bacterium]
MNHFRHYKFSNCAFESEPETPEHYYAKRVVERIFKYVVRFKVGKKLKEAV